MDNLFDIPLHFNGSDFEFPAELITYGYSYKIAVEVFGTIVCFEPDEERNYRALISPDELQEAEHLDRELLEAIAAQLVVLFRD